MVYLAALALVSAMVMHKIAARWDSGLSGEVTIQVPAPDRSVIDPTDAHKDLLEALRALPEVRDAELLAAGEIAELLKPWLGNESALADLPLPQLIAVTLESADRAALETIKTKVSEIAPDAVVDDHQQWLSSLLALARSVEFVAVLIVLLVGLSAVTMVIFVTRMGLAIHRHIVELLHLIGAHDTYVAWQFQVHALKLGLIGGLAGLLLAGLTVLLVGYLIGQLEGAILPNLSLSVWEWGILVLLPLFSGFLTMLATARFTVMRSLARMP